jgi:hypothetical protein
MLTVSGLLMSGLSEIDSVALRAPVAAGVKVSDTV